MSKVYTEVDIIERLKKKIKYGYTQKMLAEDIKISESYLSDVLCGKRSIGPAILKYFRLELVYREKFFL